MTQDLPTMNKTTFTSNTYQGTENFNTGFIAKAARRLTPNELRKLYEKEAYNTKLEVNIMDKPSRRIVQVFIVDTDDNLSLEDAIIYQGEQQFTDATDEELFFSLDIKSLLDQHNAKRARIEDKKASRKNNEAVYLEPVRIRDITMTVVDVATF